VARFYQASRSWVLLSVLAVAVLILWQFWRWEVERIEVPPGKFLILVHRWGKDLPEDEIVAPDDEYKGVVLRELPEGRHFLNPLFYSHEIHEMVDVPSGSCLVLTRMYGKQIPTARLAQRDILAREDERGIVAEVKGPGSYRLNPYAYSWLQVPAVDVRVNQVGVRTRKVGKDPKDLPADPKRGPYVVPEGYRGIQSTPVPPGTYYVNPYVETITPVEVRSHRVELADIQFPSRDGFILKPHVLVEYAVQPDKAPELFVRLADEGVLHQGDATPQEQANNEILQKIILPHIRGISRIEGSNFDARDFIVTTAPAGEQKKFNSREVLQHALQTKVRPKCDELGIAIRAVTLAELVPPAELAKQISDRELARVEQEKNKVQVRQYKAAQKLKAAESLKQQAREKVEAETRLLQAKTKAEQMKEVAESKLTTELENAQVRLDAARRQAEAKLTRGQAEAGVIGLQNEAEVAGLRKAVQGFQSVQQFAQFHVLKRLGPALTEIFASDEGDFAKLFSAYMTLPPSATAPPPRSGPPAAAGPPPALSRPAVSTAASRKEGEKKSP
jgi:SPFH domain / Band 7 family